MDTRQPIDQWILGLVVCTAISVAPHAWAKGAPSSPSSGPTEIRVNGQPMRAWLPPMRPGNLIDEGFPPIAFTDGLKPREHMVVHGDGGTIELVGVSHRSPPRARIVPAPRAPSTRIAPPPAASGTGGPSTGRAGGSFFKVAPGGSIPGYPDKVLYDAMARWATRGQSVAERRAQRIEDERLYGLEQLPGESYESFREREAKIAERQHEISDAKYIEPWREHNRRGVARMERERVEAEERSNHARGYNPADVRYRESIARGAAEEWERNAPARAREAEWERYKENVAEMYRARGK